VGKWNAEHGKRRRTGRIVIRAIKAFLDAGGKYPIDTDKLVLSAISDVTDLVIDPLGYMDGIARMDGADVDLTSELLAQVLQLTHPDHHPPERQELAHRVTQGLLALQPFVFPATKPKPPKPQERDDDDPFRNLRQRSERAVTKGPTYPCPDCADTIPNYYCDACKAEWRKRHRQEFERRTAKQRASYKRRRNKLLAKRSPRQCEGCGGEFKASRSDARFCKDICRQKAHRAAVVTGNTNGQQVTLTNRDKFAHGILSLLARHEAVFLNDILPKQRTRAQYQALCLAADRLEEAGQIESFSYMCRFGKPSHKVLLRPGHKANADTVEHGLGSFNDKKIPRLKPDERLSVA
jgi:hypothetical protein